MNRALLPAILLLAACRATNPASSASAAERALLEADRRFAADVRAHGLDAWIAAFDEHGSQVDERFTPITGHAAIREHMRGLFADPTLRLVWEPDDARVSEAGNLGSTSGRFHLFRVGASGAEETLERGRYFDVWRRLDDGSWKLLYDVGEPDVR